MDDLQNRIQEMYARMNIEDDEGGGLALPDPNDSMIRDGAL